MSDDLLNRVFTSRRWKAVERFGDCDLKFIASRFDGHFDRRPLFRSDVMVMVDMNIRLSRMASQLQRDTDIHHEIFTIEYDQIVHYLVASSTSSAVNRVNRIFDEYDDFHMVTQVIEE